MRRLLRTPRIGLVRILRYAGVAALPRSLRAAVAFLSQSNLVSFFALLAMNLALRAHGGVHHSGVGSYRDPSDPPF